MSDLPKRLEEVLAEMRATLEAALAEDRDLTDDEQKAYEQKQAEADRLEKMIERQKQLAEKEGRARHAAESAGVSVGARGGRVDESEQTRNRPEISGVRDLEAERPYASLGAQLRAMVEMKRSGPTPQQRELEERQGEQWRAATGMNEGIPAEGGFLVQSDFAQRVYDRMWNEGLIADRCTQTPISNQANSLGISQIDETSRADGSRYGGVRAYWVGEEGGATASKPKYKQLKLTLKKLNALVYATDELVQDTTALSSRLDASVSKELAFKLDDAIINGDGGGKPLGLLNGPSLVSVAKESGQTADTINAKNVMKMYARMPAQSKRNAVWLMNQACWPQVFQFALEISSGGAPMFIPQGTISDTPAGSIFGRPIIEVEQAAALGDQGDIMFVDLSQYELITKGGIEFASSIHVEFTDNETVFRWTMRVDGAPGWNSAITPYKSSDELSPFVALAARA